MRTISRLILSAVLLLLTGIASPKQILIDLQPYTDNIKSMSFPDHHQFTQKDIEDINKTFAEMPSPKIILTTEKTANIV